MRITTKIIVFSLGMLLVLALSIAIPSMFISYSTQQKELKDNERVLRQNFDELVKLEVSTVISLLKEINSNIEKSKMSLDSGKVLAATLIRNLRYGEEGYFLGRY